MGAESLSPLSILIFPDPHLRRRARAVTAVDAARVRALLPQMFATMYHAPGIGLAAPQVGTDLRVVVVDVAAEGKSAPLALINPEIVSASAEQATREEGCLSLPGQYADVTRPEQIRLRYQDETGIGRELAADGLLAACLQHELDHLDGVLFVDHLTALRRNMLLRRLAKELRQKSSEANVEPVR